MSRLRIIASVKVFFSSDSKYKHTKLKRKKSECEHKLRVKSRGTLKNLTFLN